MQTKGHEHDSDIIMLPPPRVEQQNTGQNTQICQNVASNTAAADKGLVELKNGKVIFRQKPLSLERNSETMQETVAFRGVLEDRVANRSEPFHEFPVEHLPIIAKLGYESDKTVAALARYIRQQLVPADEDDEETNTLFLNSLPLPVIEVAIKKVMTRVNYGIEVPSGAKASASVSVWRWEVKDEHKDWIPKNTREKAQNRLAERLQAQRDLASLFDVLTDQEKENIFPGYKPTHVTPAKDSALTNQSSQPIVVDDAEKEQPKRVPQGEENESENAKGKGRVKKTVDPEKAAKEKERADKKAAKADKEKKDKDAQNKSRSLMANFFTKPKASSSQASTSKQPERTGGSSQHSDFERSFKPFVLKKDTTMAPINRFQQPTMRVVEREGIIEIDADDDPGSNTVTDEALVQMNEREHLRYILRSMPCSAQPPSQRASGGSTVVRDVVNKLSEAEVTGDTALVRELLDRLEDRSVIPVKVLIFHEDSRPGLFGTWTRPSDVVGPRRPFRRDVLALDYGYDSGEEWEEEPAGDADDVVDDDDEDEGSELDSDMDDWLVEDDEPAEMRDQSPAYPDLPAPPKRKAEDSDKTLVKKRKVVVPLVPFVKGPCWESNIGEPDYESFQSFQIRAFNRVTFPLDPFTYLEPQALHIPEPLKEPAFAVPSLPQRDNEPLATPSGAILATVTKKAVTGPKTSFPEAHLPFLLDKITSLQAVSLTTLVEVVYQDLRPHKVKKNAIEAKIRQVGEKCKEKKYWVLKPGVNGITSIQ